MLADGLVTLSLELRIELSGPGGSAPARPPGSHGATRPRWFRLVQAKRVMLPAAPERCANHSSCIANGTSQA